MGLAPSHRHDDRRWACLSRRETGSSPAVTRRNTIYAIVRAGGRQYRVEPAQTLDIDRIRAEVGSTVDLTVLLIGGNGATSVGTPLLDGAKVVAEVLEHIRDKKIDVYKYKNKTRYRRRHGHRQQFTRVTIREIVTADGEVIRVPERATKLEPAEEDKPRRRFGRARRKAKEVVAESEPASEAITEAQAEEEAITQAVETAEHVGEGIEAGSGTAGDDEAPKARRPARPRPGPKAKTPARKPKAPAKPKAAPRARSRKKTEGTGE